MGRRGCNSFTLEEALKLIDDAKNAEQRREILSRLTVARLREFAELKDINVKSKLFKQDIIDTIIQGLEKAEMAQRLTRRELAMMSFLKLRKLLGAPQWKVAQDLHIQQSVYNRLEKYGAGSSDLKSIVREYLIEQIMQKYT